MTQKMVFDDVSEYEKFNKMYNGYIQNGVEASRALEMTKEAFWPTRNLSEEGRRVYDEYIFKFGLTPEDAYVLASRQDVERPETYRMSESTTEKKVSEAPKKASKVAEKEKAPVAKSWFENWFNPVFGEGTWMDTLKPFNHLFDDSFIKRFGTPCWIDFWDGCYGQPKKEKANCKCDCTKKKEEKSVAKPNKGIDIVNDEIKKVLGTLPQEEVNGNNTKVNIVRNEPNNWEFNVDHTSPDGKSHYWCSQKVVKS